MSDGVSAAVLSRQLSQAKRIIASQKGDIDVLRQQVRAQKVRLDEKSTDLLHTQRLLVSRIDRLQDECERVSALLTRPPPSSRLRRAALPTWLPPSVALLLREFTDSSDTAALDGRLSAFLVALNRLWKERVEQRGTQVAAQYEGEIAELKRRLARRLPYELITQKARILRLQKELDDTRRAHRQRRKGAGGGGEREEAREGADGHLLSLALSTVENLSAQLIEMERQNDALRRVINHDTETQHQHDEDDDQKIEEEGEEEEEEVEDTEPQH